jgi:hypothetical protein
MERKCLYCNESIPPGKKSNAKYCSDLCRVKASRNRTNSPDPFRNVTEKMTKSYTCCENGLFYSPAGMHGEVLKCDTCGAIWVRK